MAKCDFVDVFEPFWIIAVDSAVPPPVLESAVFSDTGASVVCLSEKLAKFLKLKGGSEQEALGASGTFKIKLMQCKSLSVSKALRRNMNVAVMSLEAISNKMGCPIDGILGYDYLSKYQVVINYPKKQFVLKKDINKRS